MCGWILQVNGVHASKSRTQFESEEEKVAKFVSGLRMDIKDLVELYEYSSLDKVLHLAIKVETQMQKKKKAKRSGSYNDYYSSTWKDKEKKTW